MTATTEAWVLYGAAWLMFGVFHSLTASAGIKSLIEPMCGRAYRLLYNVFALVTFTATIGLGKVAFSGFEAFELSGGLKIILSIVEIGGWLLMFLALRQYDLGLFAGTKQIRHEHEGDEPLQTSGLNRYVRHPLYSAVFLVLWGAVWTPFGLATAVFGSAYLLIGTFTEETRLTQKYGDAYSDYKARVPAYIPWRGRAS